MEAIKRIIALIVAVWALVWYLRLRGHPAPYRVLHLVVFKTCRFIGKTILFFRKRRIAVQRAQYQHQENRRQEQWYRNTRQYHVLRWIGHEANERHAYTLWGWLRRR